MAPDDERWAARLARPSAVVGNFDPLPVDSNVATNYVLLAATTHRAGRKSSARCLDLVIAATMHAHGARLVTNNFDDVAHLEEPLDIVRA